jgi:VWFA-related protein
MFALRWVAKVVFVALFLAPLAAAQQQPTFRSQSELVVVPAVVTDRSGAHISNLKKEDFTVQENGAEQKIAVLEEIHTTTERLDRAAAQPNVFSNYLNGARSERRITIIALDTINTPFLDRANARTELLKFLGNWVTGGEPMSLVVLTRSGVKVIHDFTTDPKILALALQRVRNRNEQLVEEPSLEAGPEESATLNSEVQQVLQMMADAQESMAAFQRRVAATLTLEAMQQIAQSFRGVPGRKSLLWASSGFPFSISDQSMSLNTTGRDSLSDIFPLYERTWRSLSDAQIAVYPVDLRGLTYLGPAADIGRPSRNFRQRVNWSNSERIATFQSVAEATGGRAFYNTNDLAGAFRKAAEDSASYYMLAYYRDAKDTKPGWRKLKVSVNRPGVHIHARSGFFVEKPQPEQTEQQLRGREIALAMSSPIEYTGVGIIASWKPAAEAEAGKKRVPFALTIAANGVAVDEGKDNHVRIDFFAVARTATGDSAGQVGQTIDSHLNPENLAKMQHGGMSYDNALVLQPGDYTVRFVVRDELSGRMGTVSAPLTVK